MSGAAPCAREAQPCCLCHVRGPLILFWGRLATHHARSTKALLNHCPQLRTVLLSTQVTEMNSVWYV
jgi:hypothetical protein